MVSGGSVGGERRASRAVARARLPRGKDTCARDAGTRTDAVAIRSRVPGGARDLGFDAGTARAPHARSPG